MIRFLARETLSLFTVTAFVAVAIRLAVLAGPMFERIQ